MAIKRAFSLIELLVVISIVAILVAVATASYSTMQKKGRDSRRVSDMKAVQNAFEQYYGDNNMYPTTCSLSTTYLPMGFPIDPKNSTPYIYGTDAVCNSSSYCYCALLEVGGGNATNTTCTFGSGSFYCVKNLQ